MEDISFDTFYQTTLAPDLTSMEANRKMVAKQSTTVYLCYAVAGVTGIIGFITTLLPLFVIAGVFLITAFVLTFGLDKSKSDYEEKFRQIIISKIVAFLDKNLSYSPDQFITQQEFTWSQLFNNSIDTYEGGNYVEGEIGKTKVRFSELFIQHEEGSGKNRHTVTNFKGIFFIGDFNKNLTSRTTLMPNETGVFGAIGNFVEDVASGKGSRIKMESDEFDKYFAVYSNNQQEARYILSSSLMERIVKFRKDYNHELYFLFANSGICIGIPTDNNLLDSSIIDGLTERSLKVYFDYINMCIGLVEELDLNTRIWTKE